MSKSASVAKIRHEKGTLIASGFIAGGALVGVLAALLRFIEDSRGITIVADLTAAGPFGAWLGASSNWLGLGVFLGLCLWVYWVSRREASD